MSIKESRHIIKKAISTEKSAGLREFGNQYVFEVALAANKFQIKHAVEELFNVKVKRVCTMIMHGEIKKRQRSGEVKLANWKKAMVTLHQGESISGIL